MNEYFVNNALWALFYDDKLNITTDIPIDTSTIDFALGGALHQHGFANNKPCRVNLKASPDGEPPIVRFRNSYTKALTFEA